MPYGKHPHEDQMTQLMDHAMRSVTATEELVSGGLSRGQRAIRRRRTAQAFAVGSVASLAFAAATPSFLGARDDQRPSVASSSEDGASTDPQSTPSELPPYLQRAQTLLLDSLPEHTADYNALTRVEYDPDGRGVGEILVILAEKPDNSRDQAVRCQQAAASPTPDDCTDTADGWVFTGPSLPDSSNNDPRLAGVNATYIGRDGSVINLTAYNAPKPALGGKPTRTDPVLDTEDLARLATQTEWF